MIDRRECVKSMAALPFLLGRHAELSGNRAVSDRALILVWLDGGMSHLDTFDSKPEANTDIRGDLESIPTAIDGVFFGEGLPRLAALMKELTLFRSVTHGEGQHDRASHYLLTGHRPSPVLRHPCFGTIHATPDPTSPIPVFVAIPTAPTHGRQGFLPRARGPFEVGGDPGRPDFTVKNLDPQAGRKRRIDLLRDLDRLDGTPRSKSEAGRDAFVEQALRLSLDPEARTVFDLHKEPPDQRKTYGRHRLGQSCLLARRLVENGTKTVLVRDKGWDHHRDIKRALTYGFPPKYDALDQSISALVQDLERRGLSDRVLVVVASEFGRTPRLNPAGGRDHWPRAQSVLAFGAGLRRGTVIGRTDHKGEAPAEHPISPADLHATLVTALGDDPDASLQTTDGRPIPIVERGAKPVDEALR